MSRTASARISCYADLLAYERAIDIEVSGIALGDPDDKTRYSHLGAHDPTPTPYFVLEELLGRCSFDENSHLLDVGCGKGRTLASFVRAGYPGRATGIELDPELAETARAWTSAFDRLSVVAGDALEHDLGPYTHLYLFNPFDPSILQRFIEHIEDSAQQPLTVVHMSDNGDTWRYVGRAGWTELDSLSFTSYQNDRGYAVKVYEIPQHCTLWRFEP